MQPQKKVKITKTLWECDPRKLKQKTHGSYENVIDLLGHNNYWFQFSVWLVEIVLLVFWYNHRSR